MKLNEILQLTEPRRTKELERLMQDESRLIRVGTTSGEDARVSYNKTKLDVPGAGRQFPLPVAVFLLHTCNEDHCFRGRAGADEEGAPKQFFVELDDEEPSKTPRANGKK